MIDSTFFTLAEYKARRGGITVVQVPQPRLSKCKDIIAVPMTARDEPAAVGT